MASHKTFIEIIENSGPNNLRDILKEKLTNASMVYIAVAFVAASGLDEIYRSLRQAAMKKGKVRMVTGLYQYVTEPKALKTLLRMQKETRGRCEIRLSKESHFHKKMFLIEKRSRATAITGSSNLTQEGMRSGGELDLMISIPKNDSAYKRLKEAFQKDWNKRSVPLTPERIQRYKKVWRTQSRENSNAKQSLKKILGAMPFREIAHKQGDMVNEVWCDGINGSIPKRTIKIVAAKTNWDDMNYSWYSARTCKIKEGDKIFIFDFADKRLELVKVKDTTEIQTPDGRYFVAYKPIPNCSRNFSTRLWRQLKTIGFNKRNTRSRRGIGWEIERQLEDLLRKKVIPL